MPKVLVVAPCYDDFSCVSILARELDRIVEDYPGINLQLLIVNDSPWIDASVALGSSAETLSSRVAVTVLNISANLGHQRAIAIGLAMSIHEYPEADYIVTIDSDGEDDPHHIPALIRHLEELGSDCLACVASRRNRFESLRFKAGYWIYKQMTRMLAGVSIDYGNYICFRPQAVQTLVRLPDTCMHLAASLMKSRVPFGRLSADRRHRYLGHSKMGGYSSLVLHAFRAYSVLGEKIAVRLMIATTFSVFVILAALAFAAIVRLTGLIEVFPGWGSLLAINLLGLGVISAFTVFSLALTLISSHASFSTTPLTLFRRYGESSLKIH